jgi:hypothetical protein
MVQVRESGAHRNIQSAMDGMTIIDTSGFLADRLLADWLRRLVTDQAVQIEILKEVNVKRGDLSGAGTLEIELLSQWTIEPGESAHPQGSARAKRRADRKRKVPSASLPCWTNTPGNAWPFVLGGRSEPSM